MLATAVGFAALAAISPMAILVSAFYLGSVSPRRTMLLFLAGAIITTVIMGVVILVILRAGGLSLHSNHSPRYGLRLGLGVVALAGGLFVARRRRPPADPAQPKKPGLISRTMARPGRVAALVTGIVVFLPSASFVAAVQVIATAHASLPSTAGALAAVIAVDVLLVWLPLVCHLIAPEPTARTLQAFNAWLRAHGHVLVVGALVVTGLLLIADGASGLA
jgi:hypothetical protein